MKRKDLLLLTFLLSQTTPVWAMEMDEHYSAHPTIHTTNVTTSDDQELVRKVQELQQSILTVERAVETNPAMHLRFCRIC